jgi:endonuclease YncB( thermonuclease family)
MHQLEKLFVVAALIFVIACSATQRSNDRNQAETSPGRSEAPPPASQGRSSLVGEVEVVIDGDTIDVRDQQKRLLRIQLQGIDAPEPGQAFESNSRQNLTRLVANRQVHVEWQKRDPFDRIVGKVFLENRDLSLEQLQAGLAWHYAEFADEQNEADRLSYAQAEQSARSRKLGLWQDQSTVPPWVFRHHRSLTGGFKPPQQNSSTVTNAIEGEIRGNRRSKIYHWPGCPNYDDIAPHNRVIFESADEAQTAGYRAARNCP